MTVRGQYAKGVAKRAQILETALDVVARHGYSGATVKQIADAAGMSQNGLLHYFGSKEALFSEVLQRRDEIDLVAHHSSHAARADGDGATGATRAEDGNSTRAASVDRIAAGIAALVQHNASVPGFVQLYGRLSNEATEPGHPSHAYFEQRYQTIRGVMQAALENLKAAGALSPTADPAKLAVLLVALIDGLQTQWLYDDEIDMAEHIKHFFDVVAERA